MIALRVGIVLFYILFLWFLGTQLILPTIRGNPMFPWFRRRQQLQNELDELQEEDAEVDVEANIARQRKRTLRKRNRIDKGGEADA